MHSARNRWRTPPSLFAKLHAEFGFHVDAAADQQNRLLTRWWGPGGEFEDTLKIPSTNLTLFLNPPFRVSAHCAAFLEWVVRMNTVAAVVLPMNRTELGWWHDYVIGVAAEVRTIRKRTKFLPPPGVEDSSPKFPSGIVVYRPDHAGPTILRGYEV